MNKQKTIQFLQSFVAIPLLATSMQMTGVGALQSSTVAINQIKSVIETSTITPQEAEIAKKDAEDAAKIDQYFESKGNLPLAGYGPKFVAEAKKNGIDSPFLLPAIAMIESTGGKFAYNNNSFGWNSCKTSFKSIDESIEVVALNLGGNNITTARHYDGKTIEQILKKYNSAIPTYSKKVMNVMKSMDSIPVDKDLALS